MDIHYLKPGIKGWLAILTNYAGKVALKTFSPLSC